MLYHSAVQELRQECHERSRSRKWEGVDVDALLTTSSDAPNHDLAHDDAQSQSETMTDYVADPWWLSSKEIAPAKETVQAAAQSSPLASEIQDLSHDGDWKGTRVQASSLW